MATNVRELTQIMLTFPPKQNETSRQNLYLHVKKTIVMVEGCILLTSKNK